MKRIIKSFILTLCPTLGGLCLVIGEIDDSPGLGGIGLIIIGLSFYLNLKNIK